MRSLSNITTFLHVASAGGFAEASKRLGVSTSATSKAVLRLEEELGVKLLHRTTRSVSLTDEGQRFFEGARRLVDEMDTLTAEITDSVTAPRGRLTISAPAVFGRVWLTDRIYDFMTAYPKVDVELSFDDRLVDLAAEGIDVAIRLGELSDSANVIARKLFDDTVYTVMSPGCAAVMGAPGGPLDLARYKIIHYRVRSTGRYFPFMFECDGEVERHVFEPNLVLNNVDAVLRAAERGLGVAQLPSFLAVEAIRAGRLVEVLPQMRMTRFPYSIVYLDRRLVSPRIRALVDFLTADPPRFEDVSIPRS